MVRDIVDMTARPKAGPAGTADRGIGVVLRKVHALVLEPSQVRKWYGLLVLAPGPAVGGLHHQEHDVGTAPTAPTARLSAGQGDSQKAQGRDTLRHGSQTATGLELSKLA